MLPQHISSLAISGTCKAGLGRALAFLLLLACAACDPAIGRVTWHVGDSTSYQLGEELDLAAQLRPRGDVIVRLATVPGYALGRHGPYYVGRLEAAAAPLVPEAFAAEMESVGLPVPRRLGTPDWVLVQLGTNDLGRPFAELGADPAALIPQRCGAGPLFEICAGGIENFARVDTDAELEAAITQLLGAIPTSARILWVMPSPRVPVEQRVRFRAALERAPRLVHVLELPAELYQHDGIHFDDGQGEVLAGQMIVAELDRLDGRVQP